MNEQEHAIAIARVSAGKQKEEDQTPGLVKFSEMQGYILDHVEPIKGKSAFHGRQVKQIMAAVKKHVENGPATVVIFRHVDRSSRQGVFEGYKLITQIMDRGARVEFSAPDQQFLNRQPELLGLYFKMAEAESEVKRDRKLQGNASRAARGEVNGRPAWGYDFKIVNNLQILVPNELGRKWIPEIFIAAANGKSLRFIQTMLKGVPSPQKNGLWNEATIRRIIASPTYYGERIGKGGMNYEPLVTFDLWQEANQAVTGRIKRGRGTVKREPALVRPICGACYGDKREGAPSGKSPMYRKSRFGHDYYVCTGHGPARKTCGTKNIPVGLFDAAVDDAMSKRSGPHIEIKRIPGDDRAKQLESINAQIDVLAKKNQYAQIAELSAKAAEIMSQQPVRKERIVKERSGMTEGQHWSTLTSLEEKRNELLKWEIIAYPDGRVRIATPWQPVPDDWDAENPPVPQW
jgi:DNA invertase Pin-like site-specific DNA recombinase